MIIFLYGSDTYRAREKLKEIIEGYKKIHKSGLSLKYFEGGNLDFAKFKDEFQQNSIFKEKKLLVLKNIFSNSDFKVKFLKEGKSFVQSEEIILIYEENEISAKDDLFQFLKKEGKFQEFKPLEGEKLKSWIKKEVEKYQVKIEERASEKLIEFVGNNLWQMSNEIKKLATFKLKHKLSLISEEDIDLLVRPKIETDIFKTIDALSSKNKKEALELIHKHLEKGDSPLYLLAMINFQFRNLVTIKELIEKNIPYYKILQRSNLHPFLAQKSYQQARKFTFQQLKKIYQKIFEIDYQIKTGKIEPEVALDLLVAEV